MIGYYVHHQGQGHLARARAVCAKLKSAYTLIGTFSGAEVDPTCIRLPDDRIAQDFSGDDGAVSRPSAFHYAPLNAANVRQRMGLLADWIARETPACLVVDVSCEVALFARLMSVPVVLMRLAGRRTDSPHLEAFRAAEALISPFPPEFDDPGTPKWVREKTVYVGFIGGVRSPEQSPVKARSVALVLGQGGRAIKADAIVAAAHATPSWSWQVFGTTASPLKLPPNLAVHGWCVDLGAYLSQVEIVIGACGDGLLADIAALEKRYICLPEDRAFDEQRSKARHLARRKMAIVHDGWPVPDRWSELLEQAWSLDPKRLASRHDPSAAEKAATVIESLIARRT